MVSGDLQTKDTSMKNIIQTVAISKYNSTLADVEQYRLMREESERDFLDKIKEGQFKSLELDAQSKFEEAKLQIAKEQHERLIQKEVERQRAAFNTMNEERRQQQINSDLVHEGITVQSFATNHNQEEQQQLF